MSAIANSPLTPLTGGTTGYIGPLMQQLLNRYGLGDLAAWMSAKIIRGASEEEIKLALWDHPSFRNRFKGIFTLVNKGRNPITPDEYINYEDQARLSAAAIGYSLTQDEIHNLIGNEVGLPEFEERIGLAARAVYESDNETTHELIQMGITPSNMMRYWMDPTKELPRLQQQLRMAEIMGQFRRSGYGAIEEIQAKRMAEGGFTKESALEGARQLVLMQGVFNPIDETESMIGTNEQIEYLMGRATTEEKIKRRIEKRTAEFEGGGEFVTGEDQFGVRKFATGTAT